MGDRYNVYINYSEGIIEKTVSARGPKEAAVNVGWILARKLGKHITKEELAKSMTKKEWIGNWVNWCGAYVKVTGSTGKTTTYDCYKL